MAKDSLLSGFFRAYWGWMAWGLSGISSAWWLLRDSSTVTLKSGFELMAVETNYWTLGFVVLWMTGLVGIAAQRQKGFAWALSIAITVVGWWELGAWLKEIEFVRTPPCKGMHSAERGSGGCQDGMKENFSVDELREYYRRVR